MSSGNATEQNEKVTLANVGFQPYVQGGSSSAARHVIHGLGKKEIARLLKTFDLWIEGTPVLATPSDASLVPSAAALIVAHVLNRSKRSPLKCEVEWHSDGPTFKVAIPLSQLAGQPRELVKGSPFLQILFWHHFQALRNSSRVQNHDSSCGFRGCNSDCTPCPPKDRLDFRLDRLYKSIRPGRVNSIRKEVSITKSSSPLLQLPEELLFKIVQTLSTRDISAFSDTSPAVANFLLPVVPGLQLRLYPHQIYALRRMTAMERLRVREDSMPLIEKVPFPSSHGSCLAIDIVDGSVLWLDGIPCVGPPVGGLFCDEPGLGKTITALALILKTLGQVPSAPLGYEPSDVHVPDVGVVRGYHQGAIGRFRSYGDEEINFPPRKARLLPLTHNVRSSARKVRYTDFLGLGRSNSVPCVESLENFVFLSSATLVVVPNVLIKHWIFQISQHLDKGALRVLHIRKVADLPASAAKLASNFDLVISSFDVVRRIYDDMRVSVPVLLQVHFYRLIVDEGHGISSSDFSNFSSVCRRLRAQCRWVMTGTPTPVTTRCDVDHLFELLQFIREESYGLDRQAWEAGIRAPYSCFKRCSLETLRSLLGRVMIRGDKNILRVKCSIRNVFLDFSLPSADSYNGVVHMVRRNLITADWFSAHHKESLLNKENRVMAMQALGNLRRACCFGGSMRVEFPPSDVAGMLDTLYDKFREKAGIRENDRFLHKFPWDDDGLDIYDGATREQMKRDLERGAVLYEELLAANKQYTRLPRGVKTVSGHGKYHHTVYAGVLNTIAEAFLWQVGRCGCCNEATKIPMVTPCGHILCNECIIQDRYKCQARNCGEVYRLDGKGIPEELIELQPSAWSERWVEDWDRTESAKLDYVIDRILNLPLTEEWRNGLPLPVLTKPKVIVHSQYGDHLKMVALKMKDSPLRNCYVEMTKNSAEQAYGARRRASDIAEISVQDFREKENVQVLLMNSKYGAVGLDLSFVQYVFLLEPVFDTSVELQVVSRAHRLGCVRDIVVERLVMRSSVEEALLWNESHDESGVAADRCEHSRLRTVEILKNLKTVKAGADKETRTGEGRTGDTRKRKQGGESSDEPRRQRVRFMA